MMRQIYSWPIIGGTVLVEITERAGATSAKTRAVWDDTKDPARGCEFGWIDLLPNESEDVDPESVRRNGALLGTDLGAVLAASRSATCA